MSFDIVKSEVFTRKAGKLLKKHPELIPLFKEVLTKLKENPFDISLKNEIKKIYIACQN